MKRIFIALIRCYQLCISPFFAPSCRFSPTCSQYAIEALALHGTARGLYLTLRRLLRCHPFHPGGYDPVDKSFLRQQQLALSGCSRSASNLTEPDKD